MSYQQQPQHFQQPGHVQVVYAQSAPKGMSVASMIIGLASVFFGWTFIVPIVGLVLGFVGLRKEPAGKGMAIAGIVINGLVMLGWVLLVLLFLGVFAAAGAGYLSN